MLIKIAYTINEALAGNKFSTCSKIIHVKQIKCKFRHPEYSTIKFRWPKGMRSDGLRYEFRTRKYKINYSKYSTGHQVTKEC